MPRPSLRRWVVLLVTVAALSGCKVDLYTGLDERSANEMVSVLMRANIVGARQIGGDGTVALVVSKDDFARAVDVLNAAGLPRKTYQTLGDVFGGSGFVVSQTEERARFIYAMSEELSRTISEIDGVLSARVHVVLPTSDPLSRETTPSSASVFIRYNEGSHAINLMSQIRALVANGIEGLDYENVAVGYVAVPVPSYPDAMPPQAPTAPQLWAVGLIGAALALGLSALVLLLVRRRHAGAAPGTGAPGDALVLTAAE